MRVSVRRVVDQEMSRLRLEGDVGGALGMRVRAVQVYSPNSFDWDSCVLRCVHLLYDSLRTLCMRAL